MPGDAIQGFVIIASACMIILTILAIGVSVAVYRATSEIRALARIALSEVEALRYARRMVGQRTRMAGRWALILLRKIARTGSDYQ